MSAAEDHSVSPALFGLNAMRKIHRRTEMDRYAGQTERKAGVVERQTRQTQNLLRATS